MIKVHGWRQSHLLLLTMSGRARLAPALTLSVLVVTGCAAGDPHYHDKLICKTMAAAVARPGYISSDGVSHFTNLGRAWVLVRKAARRAGYLSPQMDGDLHAAFEKQPLNASGNTSAYGAFTADCLAVGVKGPVWPKPEPISY